MRASDRPPTVGSHEPSRRVFMDVDYLSGVARVFRSDGMYVEERVSEPHPGTPIVRAVHMLGLPYLVATTDHGEDITVELPTLASVAPLHQRPVVYLDQQAWSKLALAQHEPERLLPPEERDAARWLIDLAESWAVVLPYSSGVLNETTHWSNYAKRRQLAVTVASLSRGWQMLDPLALRAAELRHLLATNKETWPLPNVWTLHPGAWGETRLRQDDLGQDLPAEHALTVNAIASSLGVMATILDSEPIGRADPHGWAAHWGALAAHVAETKKPKHLTELAVHGAIIGDASKEIAQAAASVGCTPEAFDTWLREASRVELGTLPALGLVREVTYLKVVNSAAKWAPNDLTDLFYMVEACGYADAAVGEKGFVTLVQQAQKRLGRTVNAHKTLHGLRESGVLRDAHPRRPIPPSE